MKDSYMDLYRHNKSEIKLPRFLLGSKYAPLRREFRNLPKREVREDARKILVSTGGADKDHIALEMIDQMARNPNFVFYLIVGSANEDKESIKKAVLNYSNIILCENVIDMCDLMQYVDVAISAAGSTLYELCATQTPTVTYVIADNQSMGAEWFEKKGIMKSVGDLRKNDKGIFIESLIDAAITLCRNRSTKEVASRMREIVDGYGAKRIVRELLDQ